MNVDNKLIAEFMELLEISNETYPILYKDKNSDEWFAPDELKYHTDWNWLMEVVEKIESLNFIVYIETNYCQLYNATNHEELIKSIYSTKIESVYKACVEFVKWYNEQPK